MAKFSLYNRSNNCPSCGSNDGRCKTDGNLILCMGQELNPPLGYHFTKRSKCNTWAIYAPGSAFVDDQARETWRLQQEAIKQKQEAPVAVLSVQQRHELNSKLLAELRQSNGLHPEDRVELHNRGITDAQIEKWGVVSVRRGQELKGTYSLELAGTGRKGRSLQVGGDGYLCPVRSLEGQILGFQVRIRGAKESKYRWLSGNRRVRLPNGENPLAVFGEVGDRIYLVEGTGPKPFIASQRLNGLIVGAAGGQFGGSPKQLKKLCKGQSAVLVPDGGATKNSNIIRQYKNLAELLPDLQVLWWGQIEKGGTDVDEISLEILAQAKLITWGEFEAIAIEQGGLPKEGEKVLQFVPKKNDLLERKPDLAISNDEFKDHIDEFPAEGIAALWGAQGSGKGEAIGGMLLGRTWLSVTTLRSLARDQAESWGGVFVNAGDIYNGQLLKDGQPVLGGSVCLPSLLKLRRYRPQVLVLDELPKITDFLTSSKLCNKEGIRPLLIEELARLIREAEQVIVASADLREEGLKFIEEIRAEKTCLIQSSRKPLPWQANILEGTKREVIAKFVEYVSELESGKLCVFHTDSKGLADRISALLRDQGVKNLLITSETSGGEEQSLFLDSKGSYLIDLAMGGTKVIVASPSVKEGLSIQCNTALIDSVWGIFEGCSITPDDVAQTLNRVRSLVPRNIWIAEHGRAYSKLSHEETLGAFLRALKRSSSAKVELVRRSLKTETLAAIELIDWQDRNLRLLADGEVRRNRGMKAFKVAVLASLQHEGKIIRECKCSVDAEKAIALAERMELIRSQLSLKHANAVASVYRLNDAEAQELEAKAAHTPQEQLCLERYYLEKFYRTEITCDDVLWDRSGEKRKQIRNLEMILAPEKAEQRSISSIELNTATPQDWDSARLQLELLERSGFTALARGIYFGEIVELDPKITKPIGEYLSSQPEAFQAAFNFKNAQLVSAAQLVAHCLDWCGLKRERKPRKERVEGKLIRVYSIDQENLEKLKTIVERRSQPEAPPQDSTVNKGGASGVDPAWLEPAALEDARQSLASAPDLETRQLILQYIPPEIRPLIGAA